MFSPSKVQIVKTFKLCATIVKLYLPEKENKAMGFIHLAAILVPSTASV